MNEVRGLNELNVTMGLLLASGSFASEVNKTKKNKSQLVFSKKKSASQD